MVEQNTERIEYGHASREELQGLKQRVDEAFARLFPDGNTDKLTAAALSHMARSIDQSTKEEIAEALRSRPDIEAFPPAALQFYLCATQELLKHGFVLKVTHEDWEANPEYAEIWMKAVGYGDEQGPPISANFIYHKKTGLLATRSEILSSMANSDLSWPDIDPRNQPIHGLELSVGMVFDELTKESIGRAVVNELRKTGFGGHLLERTRTVSHEWEGYGCYSAILYLPLTKEEIVDEMPKEIQLPP